jgi:hypothetical protein
MKFSTAVTNHLILFSSLSLLTQINYLLKITKTKRKKKKKRKVYVSLKTTTQLTMFLLNFQLRQCPLQTTKTLSMSPLRPAKDKNDLIIFSIKQKYPYKFKKIIFFLNTVFFFFFFLKKLKF